MNFVNKSYIRDYDEYKACKVKRDSHSIKDINTENEEELYVC